jgi:hypothetical protein
MISGVKGEGWIIVVKTKDGINQVSGVISSRSLMSKDPKKKLEEIVKKMNDNNKYFLIDSELAKKYGIPGPSEDFKQIAKKLGAGYALIALNKENKLYAKPIWRANKDKKTIEAGVHYYKLLDALYTDTSKSAEIARASDAAETAKKEAASSITNEIPSEDDNKSQWYNSAEKWNKEQMSEAASFYKKLKEKNSNLDPRDFMRTFNSFYKETLVNYEFKKFREAAGIEIRQNTTRRRAPSVQTENKKVLIKIKTKIINETKKQDLSKDVLKERLMYLSGLLT